MNTEEAQSRKERRDALLDSLTAKIPYVRFLGVDFTRMGDELTGRLNFSEKLIGNPMIPALHGGVVSAFLEVTAQTQLTWDPVWPKLEAGGEEEEALLRGEFPRTLQFIKIVATPDMHIIDKYLGDSSSTVCTRHHLLPFGGIAVDFDLCKINTFLTQQAFRCGAIAA